MRVLIACECSGTVRDAFNELGHDAWSCDLQASKQASKHIQGDVLKVLSEKFDLVIAHPPCTYLTVTGNKWFKPEYRDRFPNREKDREDAVKFFMAFTSLKHIPMVAIENPIGIMSRIFRKPDQIIHPFMFGDPASKSTCLWLKGLPKLIQSHYDAPLFNMAVDRGEFVNYKSGKRCAKWYSEAASLSSKDRSNVRSKTFPGIAKAMAEQWGRKP